MDGLTSQLFSRLSNFDYCLFVCPPPDRKHNKPEEASGHSQVKASSEDHPKHRNPKSQAIASRRGSACSERRGFYWEHLTRKTRLVKLKVEQRNSPWSLPSYGMPAGTATTGHQGGTAFIIQVSLTYHKHEPFLQVQGCRVIESQKVTHWFHTCQSLTQTAVRSKPLHTLSPKINQRHGVTTSLD